MFVLDSDTVKDTVGNMGIPW